MDGRAAEILRRRNGVGLAAVLADELTVYAGMPAAAFRPGAPYIGGQELLVARNETDRPLDMVLTYVNPATAVPGSPRSSAPPNGPVS